ncbi:YciI family protein [Acrocarpospora catenulata]|uniref:YciI family protein n=1 Tax=Acrocarpospora catenulata TaxID=2836182 RepID=UPI001BD93390|nr:YciI family protein [Acrocarpospora catenulata]
MRFLMTTKGGGQAPDEAMYAEMGKFVEEMTKAGVLLATGGLDPVGTRFTSSGGEVTVTDGPFTEAREAIVSFALIEVRSKEEAIEITRRFWKIAGDGVGGMQQVYGPE